MNTLQKTGLASKFLLATVGSTLFGEKPPKPPQYANSVADLEAYVNKLVEIS